MGGATSHTRKDYQTLQEIATILSNLTDVIDACDDAVYGLSEASMDRGRLEHDMVHSPRPYPYDTTATLNVAAAAGADNFGGYTQLIPKGTYDFGDEKNRIQVVGVNFEVFGANDTYVLEFYKSPDGATFTAIGAIRVKRAAVQDRTLIVDRPCRPLNNDVMHLYARLKSATGGNNVTISLNIARYICTAYCIPASTGTWPTG